MHEKFKLKIVFIVFYLLVCSFICVEASPTNCFSGDKIDFYYSTDSLKIVDKSLTFEIYSDKNLNHKIGRMVYTYTFVEVAENEDETSVGIASIFLPSGTISYIFASTKVDSHRLFKPGVYVREITSGTECFLHKHGSIKIRAFESGLRHVKVHFNK